jgi:hypothetical protein
LPDTIQTKVEKEVCKWTGPFKQLCDKVTDTVDTINQPKRDLLNQISDIEGQISKLRDQSITEAQVQLKANVQLVADLDKKLQGVRATLQSKTLEAAVRISTEGLKITSKALYEARKGAADAHRAYVRLKGNLAVWQHKELDIKVADNFVDPPVQPPASPSNGTDNKPSTSGTSGRQGASTATKHVPSAHGSFHHKHRKKHQAHRFRNGRHWRNGVCLQPTDRWFWMPAWWEHKCWLRPST